MDLSVSDLKTALAKAAFPHIPNALMKAHTIAAYKRLKCARGGGKKEGRRKDEKPWEKLFW